MGRAQVVVSYCAVSKKKKKQPRAILAQLHSYNVRVPVIRLQLIAVIATCLVATLNVKSGTHTQDRDDLIRAERSENWVRLTVKRINNFFRFTSGQSGPVRDTRNLALTSLGYSHPLAALTHSPKSVWYLIPTERLFLSLLYLYFGFRTLAFFTYP